MVTLAGQQILNGVVMYATGLCSDVRCVVIYVRCVVMYTGCVVMYATRLATLPVWLDVAL